MESTLSSNPSFVLHSPGSVTIENRPLPSILDPHDVLVRVLSTGICGSDVHYYKHGRIGAFQVKSPMVLGHESAGTVIDIGSAVSSVIAGDRVAMEPGIPCRYCENCHSGRYNLCPRMRFAATPPYDGTLCDVYRITEDFCHKLPDSLSMNEGAMVEPLSVGVHVMLKQASVKLGDHVVVFGSGPIGLLCCAIAQAYGAEKVVSVDIKQSRLDFALNYAATNVFDATTVANQAPEEAALTVSRQTDIKSSGADIVVDASGVESSIRIGINLVKPGGTFVQAGMGKDNVVFPIGAMCGKELNVKGSFRYGPGDYNTAIRLISTGKVNVKGLITNVVPFNKAEEAFCYVAKGEGIKTVILGPSSAD